MVDPLTSQGYTQAPQERKLDKNISSPEPTSGTRVKVEARPGGILGRVIATCSPSLFLLLQA